MTRDSMRGRVSAINSLLLGAVTIGFLKAGLLQGILTLVPSIIFGGASDHRRCALVAKPAKPWS